LSVVDRFEQELLNLRFENKPVYKSDRFGPAEFRSYFEYLIDRKLLGEALVEPRSEELWELMKAQVNFYERQLAKASEDYVKLENRLRDSQNMIDQLNREIWKKE
jgi:hypothetical protein